MQLPLWTETEKFTFIQTEDDKYEYKDYWYCQCCIVIAFRRLILFECKSGDSGAGGIQSCEFVSRRETLIGKRFYWAGEVV